MLQPIDAALSLYISYTLRHLSDGLFASLAAISALPTVLTAVLVLACVLVVVSIMLLIAFSVRRRRKKKQEEVQRDIDAERDLDSILRGSGRAYASHVQGKRVRRTVDGKRRKARHSLSSLTLTLVPISRKAKKTGAAAKPGCYSASLDGTVSVGRTPGANEIVIPESFISSRHCIFAMDEYGGVFIRDCRSTNKTYIVTDAHNRVEVDAIRGMPVRNGDVIMLGGSAFRIRIR